MIYMISKPVDYKVFMTACMYGQFAIGMRHAVARAAQQCDMSSKVYGLYGRSYTSQFSIFIGQNVQSTVMLITCVMRGTQTSIKWLY